MRWACALAVMSFGLACGEQTEEVVREPTPWEAAPASEPNAGAAGSPDAELGRPPLADGIPVPPPPLLPRGLVRHEPGVMPGYVLFNPILSDTSYLVNNAGQIVHTWKTSYSSGGGMYMLPNGHLMRPGRDPEMLGFRTGGTGGILQQIDWNGNVVWEWRLSDEQRVQHHDVEPLPNGNLLLLAWEVKSAADARRAGRRADQTPEQGLWPDWLLEIEPAPAGGAKVVWEWHVWDHLIQNHDSAAASYGEPRAHPRRVDVNAGTEDAGISPEELAQLQALGYVAPGATPEDLQSDFLHINAVAYHPRLDQIALSVPTLGEVWILDHATTTAEARGPRGDLLYRWGNPAAYGRGEPAGKRLFYQHDVRWVPDGWQGAGNLTVFNNGRERPAGPWSSIDEWTPPVGVDGRYAIAPGSPFGPEELAWQFAAAEPTSFFAPFISGASRLENGNTLICSGTGGRLLEVTRQAEVVWEYRNPFSGDVRNRDGSMPQPGLEGSPYAVFRATRIPDTHPGLAGRRLVALDPQPEWFAASP